jgi:nucleotide-binding universal stress UspA family protein
VLDTGAAGALSGDVPSSIRAILVHVDATGESATRLEVACAIAQRQRATVRALFGTAPLAEGGSFGYSAGAALEQATAVRGLRLEQAREDLRRSLGDDAPEVAWYDIVGDSVGHGFVLEALFADLVVLGQESAASARSGGAPVGFVEQVVMEAGRPTLVIPQVLRTESVGRRALIAWNGSAQAARAISGALPLLRAADEVHAVTWGRSPAIAPFSRLDLRTALAAHGIGVTAPQRAPSSHVGEELFALAGALGADLVVMGCYGHGRATERVLGGTTRSTLRTMSVPVLMVH